jgi:hypothetical protein
MIHSGLFTLLAVDFIPRFDQPPTRGRSTRSPATSRHSAN